MNLDERPHPGMDAALKAVIPGAESLHLGLVTGGKIRHTTTLRSWLQSEVQGIHPPPTKALHFGKGMGSPALVLHAERLVGLDIQIRRIDPPRLMANHGIRQGRNELSVELFDGDISLFQRTAIRGRPS